MLSEPVPNLTRIIAGPAPGPRCPPGTRRGAGSTSIAGSTDLMCAQLPGLPAQTGGSTATARETGREAQKPTRVQVSAPAPSRSSHRQPLSTQPEDYRPEGVKHKSSLRFRGISHFSESLDHTDRNSHFQKAMVEPGLHCALSPPSFS